MFLNNETDYAIRIVSCLAENEEKISAAKIAEQIGVTLPFTLKILNKLVQGKIVDSFKGNKGGYVLAERAENITLLKVVEQIYGPLNLSKCHSDGSCGCTHPNGFCEYKDVFSDITKYMRKKLGEVNFKK